ncbi:hypothetical protein YDYSG_28210 [Paenibacillus tyrfis]|uniref:hypothetical protein n=1 Tax=Paenibacillus tyrfis TaxID=1501230 RepID=UPI0024932EA5|nr:hypothetical protein [Paenibacillus tyrfis]GLI06791.1 hypothetical protein YDYSG_28210 [Paenibacillus tyrfis]
MKFGKAMLSVGLLASLIATLPTYDAHASQGTASYTDSKSVSTSSYTREYKKLRVGTSFKIPSTHVRLEFDFGQVDVKIYSTYTKVTGVKADEYPVLVIDEDNQVIYEVTVY